MSYEGKYCINCGQIALNHYIDKNGKPKECAKFEDGKLVGVYDTEWGENKAV